MFPSRTICPHEFSNTFEGNVADDFGAIATISCGHVVVKDEDIATYAEGETHDLLEMYTNDSTPHRASILTLANYRAASSLRVTNYFCTSGASPLLRILRPLFRPSAPRDVPRYPDDGGFIIMPSSENCSSVNFITLPSAELVPALVSVSVTGKGEHPVQNCP